MTFSRAETLAPDQGALYPGKSIDYDFINKCFVKPVNQIIKLTSEAVTLVQRHSNEIIPIKVVFIFLISFLVFHFSVFYLFWFLFIIP